MKRASLTGSLDSLKATKPVPMQMALDPPIDTALRSPGRPRKPIEEKRVGLTLRLDPDRYDALSRLTLRMKRQRGYSFSTHDLLIEAVDLVLSKHREEVTSGGDQ